jgi:hypothetical protein
MLDSLPPTMPPKETLLQIKERNKREIRQRTRDRNMALMFENMKESARIRRNMRTHDYDEDDTQEVSDEDEATPTIRNGRCTIPPDAFNEEFANPRRPVNRNDNSIWLYLLSFIIILLIFNVFYLQHYLLNNSALR